MLRKQAVLLCRRLTRALATGEPDVSQHAAICRTLETNTSKHSRNDAGLFYKIPVTDIAQLFPQKALISEYREQFETFRENCLMVREPGLDIINCLNQTDFSAPVNRYVIYGETGTGKTSTLYHVLHYALQKSWIIFNVAWFHNEFILKPAHNKPKEWANSSYKPGRVDLPVDSAVWLNQFKIQNGTLLNKLDLRTTKTYNWTARETTPEGSTLTEVLNFGINRIKFASDVVGILARELKAHCINNRCKMLCAIDGVNALFQTGTGIRRENKDVVTPEELTVTQACYKLLANDWNGGAVVCTVDTKADQEVRSSCYPRYLLRDKGWKMLFPFVPVEVTNFSKKEFESCMDYYLDRKWLQNSSEAARKEIEFLSGKRPSDVSKLVSQW